MSKPTMLGHDTPLGAFHNLGSWLQRRTIGSTPLSILNLDTFYPNGFPAVDQRPEVSTSEVADEPVTVQAKSIAPSPGNTVQASSASTLQRNVTDVFTPPVDARRSLGSASSPSIQRKFSGASQPLSLQQKAVPDASAVSPAHLPAPAGRSAEDAVSAGSADRKLFDRKLADHKLADHKLADPVSEAPPVSASVVQRVSNKEVANASSEFSTSLESSVSSSPKASAQDDAAVSATMERESSGVSHSPLLQPKVVSEARVPSSVQRSPEASPDSVIQRSPEETSDTSADIPTSSIQDVSTERNNAATSPSLIQRKASESKQLHSIQRQVSTSNNASLSSHLQKQSEPSDARTINSSLSAASIVEPAVTSSESQTDSAALVQRSHAETHQISSASTNLQKHTESPATLTASSGALTDSIEQTAATLSDSSAASASVVQRSPEDTADTSADSSPSLMPSASTERDDSAISSSLVQRKASESKQLPSIQRQASTDGSDAISMLPQRQAGLSDALTTESVSSTESIVPSAVSLPESPTDSAALVQRSHKETAQASSKPTPSLSPQVSASAEAPPSTSSAPLKPSTSPILQAPDAYEGAVTSSSPVQKKSSATHPLPSLQRKVSADANDSLVKNLQDISASGNQRSPDATSDISAEPSIPPTLNISTEGEGSDISSFSLHRKPSVPDQLPSVQRKPLVSDQLPALQRQASIDANDLLAVRSQDISASAIQRSSEIVSDSATSDSIIRRVPDETLQRKASASNQLPAINTSSSEPSSSEPSSSEPFPGSMPQSLAEHDDSALAVQRSPEEVSNVSTEPSTSPILNASTDRDDSATSLSPVLQRRSSGGNPPPSIQQKAISATSANPAEKSQAPIEQSGEESGLTASADSLAAAVSESPIGPASTSATLRPPLRRRESTSGDESGVVMRSPYPSQPEADLLPGGVPTGGVRTDSLRHPPNPTLHECDQLHPSDSVIQRVPGEASEDAFSSSAISSPPQASEDAFSSPAISSPPQASAEINTVAVSPTVSLSPIQRKSSNPNPLPSLQQKAISDTSAAALVAKTQARLEASTDTSSATLSENSTAAAASSASDVQRASEDTFNSSDSLATQSQAVSASASARSPDPTPDSIILRAPADTSGKASAETTLSSLPQASAEINTVAASSPLLQSKSSTSTGPLPSLQQEALLQVPTAAEAFQASSSASLPAIPRNPSASNELSSLQPEVSVNSEDSSAINLQDVSVANVQRSSEVSADTAAAPFTLSIPPASAEAAATATPLLAGSRQSPAPKSLPSLQRQVSVDASDLLAAQSQDVFTSARSLEPASDAIIQRVSEDASSELSAKPAVLSVPEASAEIVPVAVSPSASDVQRSSEHTFDTFSEPTQASISPSALADGASSSTVSLPAIQPKSVSTHPLPSLQKKAASDVDISSSTNLKKQAEPDNVPTMPLVSSSEAVEKSAAALPESSVASASVVQRYISTDFSISPMPKTLVRREDAIASSSPAPHNSSAPNSLPSIQRQVDVGVSDPLAAQLQAAPESDAQKSGTTSDAVIQRSPENPSERRTSDAVSSLRNSVQRYFSSAAMPEKERVPDHISRVDAIATNPIQRSDEADARTVQPADITTPSVIKSHIKSQMQPQLVQRLMSAKSANSSASVTPAPVQSLADLATPSAVDVAPSASTSASVTQPTHSIQRTVKSDLNLPSRSDGPIETPIKSAIPAAWSNLEDLVTSISGSAADSSAQAVQRSVEPPAQSVSLPVAAVTVQPVQTVNSATVVQAAVDSVSTDKVSADNGPTVTVMRSSIEDASSDTDPAADYSQHLELLAQEVYGLLRQRLSLEQERRGPKYPR